MNIFLPIVALFLLSFTSDVRPDGAIRVVTNLPSIHYACVRPDWGCTKNQTDSEHEFFEDGSVVFIHNDFRIGLCAYPDLGCS